MPPRALQQVELQEKRVDAERVDRSRPAPPSPAPPHPPHPPSGFTHLRKPPPAPHKIAPPALARRILRSRRSRPPPGRPCRFLSRPRRRSRRRPWPTSRSQPHNARLKPLAAAAAAARRPPPPRRPHCLPHTIAGRARARRALAAGEVDAARNPRSTSLCTHCCYRHALVRRRHGRPARLRRAHLRLARHLHLFTH